MPPRLALVLAAIALLAWPAQARADAPDTWQKQALATAQRVWHPACGTLTIAWKDPASVGGTAEWGGWAYVGNCTIYEPAGRGWMGYPDFCTAVLHEAGHAAGYGHSDRGIMAPFRIVGHSVNNDNGKRRVLWSGVDRRCIRPRDRR